VLAQLDAPDHTKTRLMAELAVASGTVGGMIGGQVADLEGEGKPPDAPLLETIHRAKTGALLRASLRMGAMAAGAVVTQVDARYEALSRYGEHIGLAFQIVDDILDVEESSEALGKTAGKDAAQHKITFPAVYGLPTSRQMAEEECQRAHAVLEPFGGRALRLHELADLIVHRKS
jgi:geranylgeranyl pyrophosphate synthase